MANLKVTNLQVSPVTAQVSGELEDVEEYEPLVSQPVKQVVYFTTELVSSLATFVVTLSMILGYISDAKVGASIIAAVAAFMLAVKQTFKLSAKK